MAKRKRNRHIGQSSTLSHEAKAWLESLSFLETLQQTQEEQSKPKKKQSVFLGFVFFVDDYDNELNVGYCKLKFHEKTRSYTISQELFTPSRNPVQYHVEGDLELIDLIDSVCEVPYYGERGHPIPSGDAGVYLIQKVVDSGRCIYASELPIKGEEVYPIKWSDASAPLALAMGASRQKGYSRPVVKLQSGDESVVLFPYKLVYNKSLHELSPYVLPKGVNYKTCATWLNGPVISNNLLDMVEGHEAVQKIVTQKGRSQIEILPDPAVHLRIGMNPKSSHYTRLFIDLSFHYEGFAPQLYTKDASTLHMPLSSETLKKGEEKVVVHHKRSIEFEASVYQALLEDFALVSDENHPQYDHETYPEYYLRTAGREKVLDHRLTLPYTPETPALLLEGDFVPMVVPRLEEKGWIVELSEEGVPIIEEVSSTFGELHEETDEAGIDWFRFDAGILDETGAQVSLFATLAEFLANHETVPPDSVPEGKMIVISDPESGRLFRVPERDFMSLARKVEDLFHNKGEKLDKVRAAAFADDFQLETSETLKALATLGQKLRDLKEVPTVDPPKGLQAELRPYQMEGYRWLQFLHEHQLNGVLADDMGLGKTLQTLTHLVAQREAGAEHPSLVIAPTSVTTNWVKEAKKFAPDLKVLLLQGADRHQHWEGLQTYDLVITSYSLIVRDEKQILKQTFHTVVLDEAQYIKNSKAKVSRLVCKLATKHRLCLSGTPLENHLGELWSLSRFLMPGLLGDESTFRQSFRTPIENHSDGGAQLALNRKVGTLILRRTKDEVAQDLPQKTEIVNRVKLGQEQTTLYEAIRASMDKKVREAISDKGVSGSQILFLEALLKLRQTCCDPRLLKGTGENQVPSAKFEYLTQELLPTLLEEGRKILLFSQFTTMLGLIEDHLKKQKVPYTKLTGATRKREEAIDAFQEGDAKVFLISLKAGGTGLNLTAADTVIHYDPWWNPAAENQATDRAHRMGQTKPVFVHRLICEGSIEERIQELQKQKTNLAESLLAGSMKKIKLDEGTLGNLLAPLTE